MNTIYLRYLLTFGFLVSSVFVVCAQKLGIKSNHFLKLSVGLDRMSLRDKGTSPLIYTGIIPSFSSAYRIERPLKRAFSVEAQYAFGKIDNQLGVESSSSYNHTAWLRAQQMYHIPSSSRLQWSAGGAVDLTTNVRVNRKLMNNQLGLDFVQNLFATALVKFPFNHSTDKEIDLFFFRIKKKSGREKYLAFQAYVPVWMSTYRNGYAYANQSGVINGLILINGYQFKVWDGLRFVTKLSYAKELKNRNRYELSYLWDAYKTYGSYNQLTAAHHSLQFALWYNLR